MSVASSKGGSELPALTSLTRFHSAMIDLELVAETAHELARYRHPPGGDGEPIQQPHA